MRRVIPASVMVLTVAIAIVLCGSVAEAQGTAYRAGGYRFTTTQAPQLQFPWNQPGFDDRQWSLVLPNSSPGSGGQYCPLVGDGRWPINRDLLVRHQISLPQNTTHVEVGFAFDNDIVAVFWNGVQIHGEARHDGCAAHDSLVVPVPPELIRPGSPNLLAVHVRDRGVISYYDHRITLR